MPRLMSVAYTEQPVRERIKTVSRRLGWWEDKNGRRIIHPGDPLTLCKKVQGRKPGEPIERLAEVEVMDVRRERLGLLLDMEPWDSAWELQLEGFQPDLISPWEFIERYFIQAQGCYPDDPITRIEWRYLDGDSDG